MITGVERMEADTSRRDVPAAEETEARPHSRRGLILPVTLALGWGVLLGYSTVLLSDDSPVRPEQGAHHAASGEPGPFEGPRVLSATRTASPWSDVPAGSTPPGPSLRGASDRPSQAPPIRAVSLREDPEPAVPPGSVAAPPVEPVAYIGTWGPTELACRRGAKRRGYLPARITETGARAGNTVCTFKDGRRVGASWDVAASCSDGGRRWSSQVKLSVDGNRLTWSSARGDASYVRCGRRTG